MKGEVYVFHVPSVHDWKNCPDIEVRDQYTGEVVSVLEMVALFQLCEGVGLRVRAKELEVWEVETAAAKQLNDEQRESLKLALAHFGQNQQITRQEVVTIIEKVRRPTIKARKYRQSGHFIDQKLQSDGQLLINTLPLQMKQDILGSKVEVEMGINLLRSEYKLVYALLSLLHDKSQNTTNVKKIGFYEGNMRTELASYGAHDAKSVLVKFRPAELYKAYLGHDDYSGHDIRHITDCLSGLAGKKMFIRYDRRRQIQDRGRPEYRTDRIEVFQPLIEIISLITDMTDKEKVALDGGDNSVRTRKGEIIVALNPIFTDQIDTKFIEMPEDTNRRLAIAAGGHKKVTVSMYRLMEYLLREISAGRYRAQINESRLASTLKLENYVRGGRRRLVQQRTVESIEALKKMGLILGATRLPNASGGYKWEFILDQDYA